MNNIDLDNYDSDGIVHSHVYRCLDAFNVSSQGNITLASC
jgi:hypothetical protein